MKDDSDIDLRVCNGKYKLLKKCASGSFGQIFYAKNVNSGEEVAVKLEHLHAKLPTLKYETSIYHHLRHEDEFAHIYWSGVEGDFNVLVMELLGPNI